MPSSLIAVVLTALNPAFEKLTSRSIVNGSASTTWSATCVNEPSPFANVSV